MARYLLSTDVLLEVAGGYDLPFNLDEVAVSRLSVEWILADNDLREGDVGQDRQRLRANLKSLLSQLEMAGGAILGISDDTLEEWGRIYCSPLCGADDEEDTSPSFEELMVMATSASEGLIYVTWEWPWTNLLDDAGINFEIVS